MPNPAIPPGLRILRTDKITGVDGRSRKAPKVANIPRIVPAPPTWIRSDQVAYQEWKRITPILARVRLLHEGSRAALAAYCAAWSRFTKAHRAYMAGEDYSSYREVCDADRSLRSWAGQLGLTPATEAVMTAAAAEVPDNDDPFM